MGFAGPVEDTENPDRNRRVFFWFFVRDMEPVLHVQRVSQERGGDHKCSQI